MKKLYKTFHHQCILIIIITTIIIINAYLVEFETNIINVFDTLN